LGWLVWHAGRETVSETNKKNNSGGYFGSRFFAAIISQRVSLASDYRGQVTAPACN
jgi:hypothetical protein